MLLRRVFRLLTIYLMWGLLVTTSFRALYALRYQDHLKNLHEWGLLFIQGARVDLAALLMLISLPLLIFLLYVSLRGQGRHFSLRLWSALSLTLVVAFEIPTIGFIEDYNTRPNYLLFEYLQNPHEVFGMLWGDYRATLILAVLAIPASFFLFMSLFRRVEVQTEPLRFAPAEPVPARQRLQALLILLCLLPLLTLGIRSSVHHRPLNPSLVAFSEDPLVNQLVLNSFYSAVYSQYQRSRYDTHYHPAFTMAPDTMQRLVKGSLDTEANDSTINLTQKKNIVVLLQESLGAEFVGRLGGKELTPQLDALASQGLWFEQLYATGTRSARGVEAVMAGFLPTSAQAVLKRPQSQQNFFTFACLARQQGYETLFVYGGEAHFDNMKSFLLNNCFDRVVDRSQFDDPVFVGSWGVSDEDLYTKVNELMLSDSAKPRFIFAFTVSNHSPWEYPEGRINLRQGEQAHTREATVRYADYALGQYIALAKASPYWDQSLFLIVADHNSRVYGADQFPLTYFHIPALLMGGSIAADVVTKTCSQIDLLPTMMSLAGFKNFYPAPGRNVLARDFKGRAVMQYYETFGLLQDGVLILIDDEARVRFFDAQRPAHLLPITLSATLQQTLQEMAIAYHLWPEYMYQSGSYRISTARL